MTHFIGQQFPSTTLSAVMPNGEIKNDFSVTDYCKGSYGIVFFYPLDFTFVCPTEIVSFDQLNSEFESRGCKVVGASIDSAYSHSAWRNTPLNEGGIGPVSFPLVADLQRKLSTELGILSPGGMTYRATYLLDQKGNIRHCLVNDLPLGRNIEEALRMVDALSFFEKHGEVCPAGWNKGQSGMKTTKESTGAQLVKMSAKGKSVAA